MRILQLITRRQLRGAEVFATQLADELVVRGHTVLVAGISTPRADAPVPERASWVDVGASLDRRLDLRTLARVSKLVRSVDPEVVQANGSDTLKYSVLARLVSRGDWRLVYRNISVASRWLTSSIQRAWNGWLVRGVDHVVSVSRYSREDFSRTYGVCSERVSTIPQAIFVPRDVSRNRARKAIQQITGVDDDAFLLMHVGSFSEEKNHFWLLDAFRRLGDQHPATRLVLVGDGPLFSQVEERVRSLGLVPRVHLLGSRPDVTELVAAADLLLLPSLVEGMPGVILEAAAQRVPTVATDVGGVHEIVRHGETGLLVPPRDMEAFQSAVSQLIEEPDRRLAMAVRARELADRHHNLRDIAAKYEEVYSALLSDGVDPDAQASLETIIGD